MAKTSVEGLTCLIVPVLSPPAGDLLGPAGGATPYVRWRTRGDVNAARAISSKAAEVEATGERRCTQCQVVQPLENFNRSKIGIAGRHPWCRACRSASRKALYQADPEYYREYAKWKTTKHRFGVTQSQYEEKLAAQGGLCMICRQPQDGPRLAIDHDHRCCVGTKTCGQCLRDLLCFKCNTLLGVADDDIDRLLAAAEYLRRWSPSL